MKLFPELLNTSAADLNRLASRYPGAWWVICGDTLTQQKESTTA